jgi:hypothetical protein
MDRIVSILQYYEHFAGSWERDGTSYRLRWRLCIAEDQQSH